MPAFLAEQFEISSSEARRLIKQGAVKLDGQRLSEDRLDLEAEELRGRVLQVGKRRFLRVAAQRLTGRLDNRPGDPYTPASPSEACLPGGGSTSPRGRSGL